MSCVAADDYAPNARPIKPPRLDSNRRVG